MIVWYVRQIIKPARPVLNKRSIKVSGSYIKWGSGSHGDKYKCSKKPGLLESTLALDSTLTLNPDRNKMYEGSL